jgi:hypothetical protein
MPYLPQATDNGVLLGYSGLLVFGCPHHIWHDLACKSMIGVTQQAQLQHKQQQQAYDQKRNC